jgi:hypothetical protein
MELAIEMKQTHIHIYKFKEEYCVAGSPFVHLCDVPILWDVVSTAGVTKRRKAR